MQNGFFAMLSRMKHIVRWGLMRNTRPENLSEHSLETAVLAHALALIGNRRLGKSYDANRVGMAAIFHDCPEILTGDLPTPVKYYSGEIQRAYKAVEKESAEKLLQMLPEDLCSDYAPLIYCELPVAEKQLLKAADKLSALIKCLEEARQGNGEFKTAEAHLRKKIAELSVPEAGIFISEFLGAYELTLDELNQYSCPSVDQWISNI
ncbi:MAG: 5'-deoxynucleotidase [Oscillospiraceae bacterium]|jgi:5'-deoxynucleotidase|nr:5'-deoxynucleotidase [Oscillospiraceae bacterium]